MSVTYLTTPIAEVRQDPPPRGSGMTREGYTKRSGAPTSRMIRLQGEKRWRRLMVWQFSNLGTMFVNINGKPHVVREEMLPEEGAVTSGQSQRVHHATRKSPVQLDREIAQSVGKRIDRKKLGEMMSSWGGDFAYGEGTGSVGAVSSYYYSGKKYPDRTIVARALKAIEADVPKAEHGAHGWTKSDAKDLRTIAQGLRYYLHHDYSGGNGGRSHSTISRDDGPLVPTAEARRHVQTIQRREDFPEILAISMRADGTNYQVKVPDSKNKRGYDLVDVLIHHNGMRSIKSASRSRTTPERASKIVKRYLEAAR